MKKFFIVAGGLVLVLGVIIGLKAVQIGSLLGFVGEMEEAGLPPVAVATALAEAATWEETLRFTGTLRAVQGVTLTAELGGVVSRIAVENGQNVAKGDLLIAFDTSQEEADLASLEARRRLAELNLSRNRELHKKNIIAQSDLDDAGAAFDAATAEVESLRALIARKTIRAPFDGQVGIRLVNLGQTVAPGDPLMPLHMNDPIYVEFAVPQTRLAGIEEGQLLRVSTDGLKSPVEGMVTAVNPVVDESSRTARVQGTLANPQGLLRPGQFATVDVVMPEKSDVVMIPVSSLIAEAYGDSVFIVEESDGGLTARQQFVQAGRQRGDFVSVLQGVNSGDRVVSAGAFKLSNGASVTVDDEMQPVARLNPSPDNS